jgi:hypothetical protein
MSYLAWGGVEMLERIWFFQPEPNYQKIHWKWYDSGKLGVRYSTKLPKN